MPNLFAPALALLFVLTMALPLPIFAQTLTLSPSTDHVKVDLIGYSEAVSPGKKAWIGLRMRHDPHWHTYWKNPGDSGLPTQFELTLPSGVKSGPIHWPKPERIFIPPLANYGYENEIVLSREIELPANFSGDRLEILAKTSWLVCKEVCIPGEAQLTLTLAVKSGAHRPSLHQALFEKNWAREPKIELPVRVSASASQLALLMPPSIKDAKRVEFFAGSEETIIHPAPQELFKLSDGSYRLEIALASEKRTDFSKTPERAAGVLDIDGQFFVVNPSSVARFADSTNESAMRVAILPGAPASASDRKPSPAEALRLATAPAEPESRPGFGATASPQDAAVLAASEYSKSLLFSLGAALLGGLILNLMPCVFPVIGLKLMSFAGQGGSGAELSSAHRKRLRIETLAFAGGVVLSFLVLGGLMLFLRSIGQSVGWGFQLQSPLFVGAMMLLFVALALNFAGLFEVGLGLTRLGNLDQATHRQVAPDAVSRPHPGSAFLSGVLAVLVATPCTAPFMGSALGFSLAQPPLEALLVFAFLGLGMALPYLLFAAFPVWLKHLPKPGRWMESFKQFLAFPMLAAAVWLLWVFGLQTSPEGLMRLALGAVALAFSLWLYGRFFQGGARLRLRSGSGLVAVILILVGGLAAVAGLLGGSQQEAPEATESKAQAVNSWRAWSVAAVAEGLSQGRPVFVDFTAAWCVSCQANKQLVLQTDKVSQAFAASKTLLLKADWTKQDPLITAELNRHGRSGVPLYLLYIPGQVEALVLPEILTQSQVLSALARAKR